MKRGDGIHAQFKAEGHNITHEMHILVTLFKQRKFSETEHTSQIVGLLVIIIYKS